MIPKTPLLAAALFLFTLPASARADTRAFDAAMKPVLEHYLAIQKQLASDSTEGVKAHARAIAKAAPEVDPKTVSGEHAKHYAMLPKKIAAAAEKLAKAGDLAAMREAFKALSRPMAMWGQMSAPEGIGVVFCSMAKASWVQQGAEVKNPYYGEKMLGCGEFISGGHGKAMKRGGE